MPCAPMLKDPMSADVWEDIREMVGAVKVPIGELPFRVLYDKHNYSKTWRAACDFIIDYFFMLSEFVDFALNKRDASLTTGRLLH